MQDKRGMLFAAGRELFLQRGFKDVSVSDITSSAGVSVGSFYNYFESKERLFLEAFLEENRQAKQSIVGALDQDGSPEEITREYVERSMELNRDNRILREWYGTSIADELHRYFDENGKEDVKFVRGAFAELLERWKREQRVKADTDIETLLSIFDMLVYLDHHQDEIPVPNFCNAMVAMGDYIIKGFTANP